MTTSSRASSSAATGVTSRGKATFWNRVLAGVVGGVAGGLIFGMLMAVMGMLRGLLVGMVYGAIWWVLGPLVIMPLMMGMPVFAIDTTALFSLMGHIVYGGILGVVAVVILSRRR